MSDDEIIRKSFDEDRILITNDKDFAEKVYRERLPHRGIILVRLNDERGAYKIETLWRLLDGYADRLKDQFVVVTETQVRFEIGRAHV